MGRFCRIVVAVIAIPRQKVKAKAAIPGTATNDELKAKYRVVMNKLIIVLAQAENAALEGDQDALAKYIREANTVKGEGHEMFIADDE